MSKKKKAIIEKNPVKPKAAQKTVSGFDRLEERLSAHRKKIFYSLCFLTALFTLLLFNIRISEGADDSTYVYGGYKYSKDFFNYFFTYNAPLWPMFLGIMIKIFGLNLVILKFTAALFYFFSFIFFYKALEKRVPYFILVPVGLFYAVNSHLQYFSSQTYNESFFLFFQSLFIYVFCNLLDRLRSQEGIDVFKQNWRQWIFVGVLMAILSLAKNLGVVVFPIVVFYFITQKQWKNTLIVIVVSVGARFSYELIKRMIWGSLSQFSSQSAMFLRKNPYLESSGNEDISGFITRFLENTSIYLANRLMQILGFIKDSSHFASIILTVILVALLLFGVYRIWKSRDQILLFVCLYVGGSLAVSFIILHVVWAQERLIVIFVPALLIVAYYAVYKLVSKYFFGYLFYLLFIAVVSGSFMISSVSRVDKNIPILKMNMKGDLYYGYTPDWVHFLKMSRWCADNLPPDAVVVSRKAAMSFIYGNGKEFFPINRNLFHDPVKKECNPDSLLAYCKQNKIKYFMLASLRFYPDHKSKKTINTIEVLFTPLRNRDPSKIVFVRAEGDKDDEPCILYEIKY